MKLYAVTLALLLSSEDPMHSAWESVARTRTPHEHLEVYADDACPPTLRSPVETVTCSHSFAACTSTVEVCS